MLHMIVISDDIYLDLVKAADDAKLTIEKYEAQAVENAVKAYRRRKRTKHQHDDLGVIPGGD